MRLSGCGRHAKAVRCGRVVYAVRRSSVGKIVVLRRVLRLVRRSGGGIIGVEGTPRVVVRAAIHVPRPALSRGEK